jgi:hypothetical protein
MCRERSRRLCYVILTFITLIALRPSVIRAQQPASLPSGWQQMSATDFASVIRSLVNKRQFGALSPSDKSAASAYGKQLFLQINVSSTSLDYQTLEMLHWVCRFGLSPSVIEQTRTALLARQDNWAGQPYAEVRAKVMMMSNLQMPTAVLVREAQRWIAAGGTLAQVPPADLRFAIVRQAMANLKVISGSFSVQWSGRINAPQSGDYTFFVSPINVNAGYNSRTTVHFQTTVSVAGQMLLESTPSDAPVPSYAGYQPFPPEPLAWTSQSKPVTLTAGQPASILVTVTADVGSVLPLATLHAMLYWQGPGVSKSLVPAANVTLPNGSGQGLQAVYSWTSQGQPQSLTRTDPMIDFAWTTDTILLSQDTTIANQAANAMWQAMTSANFLASLTGPPVQMHPFFQFPNDVSTGLTTAQRQAFGNLLLQNPKLLDPVDAKTAVRFYQAFRMGAPDAALDVFGAWAARHANLLSELSNERVFDGDNSDAFAALAIDATQQLPEQAARLQSEFLQLPDGRCALPVAYTLGFSYLGRGKAPDWLAILDAKLADPTVTGDVRVNWLLARGTAEEFGEARPRHYPFRTPFPGRLPLRGRKYFEQAITAAQSPPYQLRAAYELAARLAWGQRFDAAIAVLQPLANSLPAALQPRLAAWMAQLNGYAAAQKLYFQNRQGIANQSFIQTLQSRRDQAAGRGDTASVDRYNSLINAAQNRATNP